MDAELKATDFWSKTYPVKAVRITEHNIRKIAEEMGECYSEDPNGFGPDKTTPVPRIILDNSWGFVGDWAVLRGEEWEFYTHEAFLRGFQTHSEQMSKDARYARIFMLVSSAMAKQSKATYNQDENGMDLVAIETTKKIIGEL